MHVLVLGIPARGQGCVHVTRVSVPRGVHRRACVARVGCGHLWPSGGDWGGMQSGSTAHQTGFHPGSRAIERDKFLSPSCSYPLAAHCWGSMKHYMNYLSAHPGRLQRLLKPDTLRLGALWEQCRTRPCPGERTVCEGISLRICIPGWQAQPVPPRGPCLCPPPTGGPG